jgi:thiol-disulfide isomerase/thioredoxin
MVLGGLLLGCQQPVGNPAPLAVAPAGGPAQALEREQPSGDAQQTEASDPAPASNPPLSDTDSESPADKEKEKDAEEVKAAEKEEKEEAPRVVTTEDPEHPFPRQIRMPEFPRDMEWLNTKPLKLKDVKGKFVLLDFWTYCCINCIHILPELKKLEHTFPNELVVIGVHSAKFDTEKDTDNIREAILRYEIEHPVVNDSEHGIWEMLGVSSWPTLLMIDPAGNLVWGTSGEFKAEDVEKVLKRGIAYYRKKELLSDEPLTFELEATKQPATPLRFPGKVLADEAGARLFISDSNHNRIVVTGLDGKLLDVIGGGTIGSDDGGYTRATFHHAQGMALAGDKLYVADTENHLLRQVDLTKKQVRTIAGVGIQARSPWPGAEEASTVDELPERFVGKPLETALNSPWDLWIHKQDLYIAMAGPHQIWKMPLKENEIGPYAGNAREDIVDGPLLPKVPYQRGYASFAQPSGLSSDGTWLYVADSEGSSVRTVPFDADREVKTLTGSAHLPSGRLFAFGDRDGDPSTAKLQHALGVCYVDGKVYVTDTYNNKLKVVDAKSGDTKTLAGLGQKHPGKSDEEGTFDEPAGVSHAKGVLYIADTNNHLIRTYDLSTKRVGTFTIDGLAPPAAPKAEKPSFEKAAHVKLEAAKVQATDGQVKLKVQLLLPSGYKINPLAPMSYWLEAAGDAGPVDRAALGKKSLPKPAAEFDASVPVKGEGTDTVTLSMKYSYCAVADEGVCKLGSVVFTIPLTIAADSPAEAVTAQHKVTD